MSPGVGWLTLHEVLEETGLPYRDLMTFVERGLITTRSSGRAILYDVDDVRRLTAATSG